VDYGTLYRNCGAAEPFALGEVRRGVLRRASQCCDIFDFDIGGSAGN